jgi:hypothetical protein
MRLRAPALGCVHLADAFRYNLPYIRCGTVVNTSGPSGAHRIALSLWIGNCRAHRRRGSQGLVELRKQPGGHRWYGTPEPLMND